MMLRLSMFVAATLLSVAAPPVQGQRTQEETEQDGLRFQYCVSTTADDFIKARRGSIEQAVDHGIATCSKALVNQYYIDKVRQRTIAGMRGEQSKAEELAAAGRRFTML